MKFFGYVTGLILWVTSSYGQSRLLIQSAPALDAYNIQWAADDKLLVSKSRRGEIRVWRSDTGALLQVLPPVDPMGAKIAVSGDGSKIAGIRNGRAVVIDRLTGANVWEDAEVGTQSLTRLEPPFLTIVSGRTVKRVDFSNGTIVQKWMAPGAVKEVHALGEGATAVVLYDRSVVLLDKGFQETGRIKSDETEDFYFGDAAGDTLALATFGGVFVASSKGTEKLWKKTTRAPGAFGVRLSPDGLALAVGASDGRVSVLSTVDFKELWQSAPLPGIQDLAWNSDQSKLAFATNRTGIMVMDAKSGEKLQTFGAEEGIEPLEVPERVLFDGRSEWLGIRRAGFVHVALEDGSVRFFDTKQAVQPATRPESEAAQDVVVGMHPCLRFQRDGRLIEKLAPASVFDSGRCGADGFYFRDDQHVSVYRTAGGKTEKEGMFALALGSRCIFSADGQVALDPGGSNYVVRKAPSWEVAGVIPKLPEDHNPSVVWMSPDHQWLTWMDDGMFRYDFKTSKRTELIPSSASERGKLPAHAAAADRFLRFSPFVNPAAYRIHSARDGAVLYESKPWRAFADELDLWLVGLSSNKAGLWLCGSGCRPILVDLETGQPVLRLHVFKDSTYLWETPDGRVAGSPEAKGRCFFVSSDGMKAENDASQLKWDPEGVKAVLRVFNKQ